MLVESSYTRRLWGFGKRVSGITKIHRKGEHHGSPGFVLRRLEPCPIMGTPTSSLVGPTMPLTALSLDWRCLSCLTMPLERVFLGNFFVLTLSYLYTHTLEFIFIREGTHSLSFTLLAFLYMYTYIPASFQNEFFVSFCLHDFFTLISELMPILTLQYQQEVFYMFYMCDFRKISFVYSDEMRDISELVIANIVETHFLEFLRFMCEYERFINNLGSMVRDFHFFHCFCSQGSMIREFDGFFHGFCTFIVCYCLSDDSVYVHRRCVIDVRMLLGRNIRRQNLNVANVIRHRRSSQIFELGTNLVFSVLSGVCVNESIDDLFVYSLYNLA